LIGMVDKAPGLYAHRELLRQPDEWADAARLLESRADDLRVFWSAAAPRQLFFAGCGSAYFAGMAMAAMANHLLHIPAHAAPGSEMILFPEAIFVHDLPPLMIALSRSGETSETVLAVAAYRRRYPAGKVLALHCNPSSTLAQTADYALDMGIREEAVVQTGSLSTMLLFTLGCVALWSGENAAPVLSKVSQSGAALLQHYSGLAEQLGTSPDFDRFFFLGSGAWCGVASEAMLKVKEMSFAQSEAYHTLEFRHGLGANAAERSLVVGFLSDRARDYEQAVLDELRSYGAHTLAIGANVQVTGERAFALAYPPPDVPGWVRLPLALPFIHLLGYHRALLNGRDPDRPANLTSFITLESALS
jgi:glutamine---fructose-6-phosphate transaminase (isomerizing)